MSIRIASVLLVFFVWTAGSARSSPFQESSAPCTEPGTGWICYGEHASCSLSVGDIDDYRFWGEQQDTVLICVSGTSNCLDPRIDVLRPNNTILAHGECQ